MRILNLGSLNIDYTYKVPHIVQAGETISSTELEVFSGGKGLNQSVALAKAGAEVFHARMVGCDGDLLLETLKGNGIDTRYIKKVGTRSGNAIIQLDKGGENSIVLYGGANRENTENYINMVLDDFGPQDWMLVQNEINLLDYMIDKASERAIKIALNPSPFNVDIIKCDLSKVDLFLINEIEGKQITGKTSIEGIAEEMRKRFPKAEVVLTLGSKGALFISEKLCIKQNAFSVNAIDTTAAGDTFTGYFIQNYLGKGTSPAQALEAASRASAVTVTRLGASVSIPTMDEVNDYFRNL